MYHILLLEDDCLQLQALKEMLLEYQPAFIIEGFSNIKDAADSLSGDNSDYDLFLLDVKLQEGNENEDGILFGKKIRTIERYSYTPVVYITSVPELVQKALNDVHCFNYLLKPYTKKQLFKCLDYLMGSPQLPEPTFVFQDFYGGRIRMKLSDILYFSVNPIHHLVVASANGNFETTDYTLEKLSEILPKDFLRCHRKYLISLKKVTDFDRSRRLIYMGKTEIPLGRAYKDRFESFWESELKRGIKHE